MCYEYHLDSALVKPTREMAHTSGFDPTLKVKICFDCKMFDVANWAAYLNGEDGPGGTLSHKTLSVASQRALEISSVIGQSPSLVIDHFSSPRVLAKLCKRDEGCRPLPQRPQYPNIYRLLINVLELKAISLALKRFKDQYQNQTMLVASGNSITVVTYINKQRGTHSAEMYALLWKIMTWCHHYQKIRVPECDG